VVRDVVASAVDSDATYVAGTRSLLHDLLRTEGFAFTEVAPDDMITVDQ
jgi:hypothetical protein